MSSSSGSESQRRVDTIIQSVSSIQRRLQGLPVTTDPKASDRGMTFFNSMGPTGVNINENFIKRVNKTSLEGTLYHESIHAEQMRMPLLRQRGLQPILEFHAHERALRHVMKLPDNQEAVRHSIGKLKKYGQKVAQAFPHLSGNIQRQLDRIQRGEPPAKHNVRYWAKRI